MARSSAKNWPLHSRSRTTCERPAFLRTMGQPAMGARYGDRSRSEICFFFLPISRLKPADHSRLTAGVRAMNTLDLVLAVLCLGVGRVVGGLPQCHGSNGDTNGDGGRDRSDAVSGSWHPATRTLSMCAGRSCAVPPRGCMYITYREKRLARKPKVLPGIDLRIHRACESAP